MSQEFRAHPAPKAKPTPIADAWQAMMERAPASLRESDPQDLDFLRIVFYTGALNAAKIIRESPDPEAAIEAISTEFVPGGCFTNPGPESKSTPEPRIPYLTGSLILAATIAGFFLVPHHFHRRYAAIVSAAFGIIMACIGFARILVTAAHEYDRPKGPRP